MSDESVVCPICSLPINSTEQREINAHIDECLTKSFLSGGSGGGEQNLGSSGGGPKDVPFDMDALLAQELGQSAEPEIPDDVGMSYKLTCPYPACNQSVMAYEFIAHAKQYHTACSQQLGCPLCEAESGVAYTANENTNLLQHLNNAHADMSEMQRVMIESRKSFLNQLGGRIELPTTVGHGHTVKVLDKNMEGKECSICFEEYSKGDKVAFLECFCMYHEACIMAWFDKAQRESCPFHQDDEDL